jgi:hypothetical protein
MRESTLCKRAAVLLLPALLLFGACDDGGPTEPRIDMSAVVGIYTMTQLSFDPQGSLPASDILIGLDEPPTLELTTSGQAQVLVRDPVTSLVVTINGNYQTTTTGVRIDFPEASQFTKLLLSSRMDLTFNEQAGTLSFSGTAPDGVSRAQLVALVPSLADEQLLDPTPGVLAVRFTRTP